MCCVVCVVIVYFVTGKMVSNGHEEGIEEVDLG